MNEWWKNKYFCALYIYSSVLVPSTWTGTIIGAYILHWKACCRSFSNWYSYTNLTFSSIHDRKHDSWILLTMQNLASRCTCVSKRFLDPYLIASLKQKKPVIFIAIFKQYQLFWTKHCYCVWLASLRKIDNKIHNRWPVHSHNNEFLINRADE